MSGIMKELYLSDYQLLSLSFHISAKKDISKSFWKYPVIYLFLF